MNFFMVCKVGFDPLFLTHHGVIHPAAVVIGAEHDAFGFVNAVGGIPQLAALGVRPGNTTIDVQILPETVLGLKCGFVGLAAPDVLHCSDIIRGEIVIYADHQMCRNAVEAIIHFKAVSDPILIIGHIDTLVCDLD